MPLLRPDVLEIFRDWRQVSCLYRIFTGVWPITEVAALGGSEKGQSQSYGWTGRLANQGVIVICKEYTHFNGRVSSALGGNQGWAVHPSLEGARPGGERSFKEPRQFLALVVG
ncbi:hypothetical protein MGYG_06298 [Nannizzia gypsea CBS 118893]|uniref:Uncharacterized protein n=1 Tax=Arthroderma gypseum (strain ATCC MYA-4604 / CBS 118893) TaxID=535722 RepID=E4UYW7_ARTGP|nr:hypothetical protein MGYG_06298 [Nannizzia gypsea CBS 118893]EFR03297.1 hypothetical protein MGYG_06298 [Nannizzia gypsea CBS 118893]